MRKNLLAALLCVSVLCAFTSSSNAQGTLIHYWNFNNYTTTYNYPQTFPIGPFDADFSIHDTSKARLYMVTYPGTSATWHNASSQPIVLDPYPTVAADSDNNSNVNLRLGAVGGNSFRPRNPLDSAYLYFYIPTTNYQNIKFSYGCESSSTSSGDTYQYYDYSVDSGLTWITTGLSQLHDSAYTYFHTAAVTIANPAVNNNPKLVFRIHFVGDNTGTKGNDRFDNVTVDGDSILSPVLIHYWNYNTFATTYNYPATPPFSINADYSILDPTKARTVFGYFPGTSAAYHNASSQPIVFDFNAETAGIPDYDTVNLRMGAIGGTAIRPRNPLDSAYLYFYIPSTGYHDVTFTYGCESSGATSGDTYQTFDYSTDSGTTWKNTLLSIPRDSAYTYFKKTAVTFTSDSAANNNPKLVFRIHFIGFNTGTKGNDRFDNVSLDGIPYIVNSSITTTASSFGPFCNAIANSFSVAYSSVGNYTGTWSVQLSNSSGSFASGTSIIGTGTSSPISAFIPSGTATGTYRVRVINTSPAISGTDNGSNIIINGPPTAYNVTGSAGYCAGGTGVPIGLANSQTGIKYKLYLGGSYINDSVNGGGSAISFGNQASGGTYTVVAINTVTPTCTSNMTGNAVVTVNPVPSAITGNNTICANGTETLSDGITGGTWSSGFTTAATIDPNSGFLTALAPFLTVVTYTLPGGCSTTANVIVNGAVPAIIGTANVCTGLSTILNDDADGTWSSGNNSIATIDQFSGTVYGVAAGAALISYNASVGCTISIPFTVNQSPAAIAGPAKVCVGSAINLTDAVTGGSWSSSDGTALINTVTGMLTGAGEGNPNIVYTLPAGGCSIATPIEVDSLPSAISGTPVVCAGSITALGNTATGSWSSSNTAMAIVDGSGNVSGIGAGTPVITFALATGCQVTKPVLVNPLPSGITGATSVCRGLNTTLNELTTGGTWSSSNSSSASIDPVSGNVTGVAAGTAGITYTLSTGCKMSTSVVVNPLPSIIAGNTNACVGQVTILSDTATGGTWSSANSNVSIDMNGGSATGVSNGTSVITYKLPTGCVMTTMVTVSPLSPITGLTAICSGLSAVLSDATTGGTWSSDNTAAVAIDPVTGGFTSPNPGLANITYTMPTGCAAASSVNVSLSPNAITGIPAVCTGAVTALTDDGGGSWSSSNTLVATVAGGSGFVGGVLPGTATITYQLSGCTTQQTVTVNPSPSAITGVTPVCPQATINVHDMTTGGSWSAGAGSGAVTVDAVSGALTGVTAGNAFVTYTLPTGCSIAANILINPLPPAILGVAQLCATATTTLGNLAGGGTWSSGNTALATINATSGIVSGLSAGTPVITYKLPTGCMTTVPVTVNALPAVYTITGGGSYCAGSGGVHLGLSGSVSGVDYQLFYGITHVGSPLSGTGSTIDFGLHTLAETYAIVANDATTGCTNNMAGSVSIVMNSLPSIYTVTGGGHFCASGTGVHIGLSGGNTGINYQLYNTGVPDGPAIGGSTSPVDFGLEATAGSYTVMASNASTGCTNNMGGSAVVTVDPNVIPSVSIAASAGDVVCAGTSITITATPVNGGPAPAYSWSVNGASVSVAGGAYTYMPADGDNVTAVLTSSSLCASPVTAGSSLTVGVLPNGAPTIHISASTSDTVCQGTLVHYASVSSYGGAAPVMAWVVNGAIAGYGNTYSYTPENHDVISSILGSNYQCRSSDSGMSNSITMQADVPLDPVVSITPNPVHIAFGQSVTFAATVANGGPVPAYQWYVNGSPVPGAGSPAFTGSNFSNGDSVSCKVVSSGVCSGRIGSGSVTVQETGEGVQQIASAGGDIRLTPNPNKGIFTIKGTVAATGSEEMDIVVTDMLGQVVYSGKTTAVNGKVEQQISLNNTLVNGMYLLNLRSATQNDVFHFVIEK